MERSGAWSNLRMPITLAYVSSILKKEGYNVKLVDDIALYYIGKPTNIKKLLRDFSPEIVILNTAFQSVFGEDMENARLVKEANPNTKVIMFGVAPTLVYDRILKKGFVDICIIRESEENISKLCEFLQRGKDLSSISNIAFRRNGKVIVTKEEPPKVDLDELPYPDYESLPLDAYRVPIDKQKQVLLDVSRGCPHRCIYCVGTRYYGHKVRIRKPENVIKEIEHVMSLGVSRILFWADTFTINRKWLHEVCNLMIEKGINKKIKWIVNSRVDTVDLESLKLMEKAGCYVIGFGVESGVQEILNYVKKGIKLQNTINAFKWAGKTRIRTAAHVVFGLAPFENRKTILKTIWFVHKLKPKYANFHVATPYLGTELYDIYSKEGYIEKNNLVDFETTTANISLPKLSRRELEFWRGFAFFTFFFSPRFILQQLSYVRSFKELLNLIGNGFWWSLGWINIKKKD